MDIYMAELRVDILTLFPEMFDAVLNNSIIGRAVENGILEINCVQIRDFAFNKHRQVDDYPYGGGQGMVMQAEPIYLAYMSVCEGLDYKPLTIYMSPQGKTFRQSTAKRLAKKKHIVILCGHYEGVDQRIIDEIVDEEISIGDFVLTGGEIPACIVTDAVARLCEGVLSDAECYENESISSGLLEYPQYTRPFEFHGVSVPDVLISGHHENIDKWRCERAEEITKARRPDLYEKYKSNK
jgi:tRNA (guanine37-N1)-methyltransferase